MSISVEEASVRILEPIKPLGDEDVRIADAL